MKKVLGVGIILLVMLLSACGSGKVHESVDEGIAKDARQVMDRIKYNVDKGIAIEDVSDEDDKLFDNYTKKYIDENSLYKSGYKDVEEDILIMSSGSLVKYAKGISLESEIETLKDNEEIMEECITTGKAIEKD